VFIDELEKFFSTELYSKIKTAKRVIREQRFNILLPPSMFSKDDAFIASLGDELLAVQGVIDLVIIDGQDRLCLYDYKTDRLSKAELDNDALLSKAMCDRHSEQLSYYKLAISRLFERECDVAEIYSTHAAKTVKV
jgi:ATP-dependent exoDNAse (exonuclease V) beta subunit